MTDVRVTAEPVTYAPAAAQSYFRDLALAELRADQGARARLTRHGEELDVELPKLEHRARRAAEARGLEMRVNPNRTPGQGGYFAPPLWLIEKFATAPRPGRVLAELMPSLPLPGGVSSVNLPRLTTGGQTSVATDGHAASSSDDVEAIVASPATPIFGQGDVALQLLEQSPRSAALDWAIFSDLAADYDAKLEGLLLNGTGQNGQFHGVLNVPIPTANQVAYTDGTPTGSKLYPFLGQAAAAIGDNRQMPPEIWLMRTARWAWLGTAEDAQGMPLAVAQYAPPGPIPYLFDDRRATPVTAILGWPAYCNDAIPATLAAAGQDAIVACRPTDMLLLEAEPRTAVMRDVLSGTLQARLQLRGYAAALTGRYPTGIARVTGTGMTVAGAF